MMGQDILLPSQESAMGSESAHDDGLVGYDAPES